MLVIFAQSSSTTEPCKCSFNHPAPWKDHKSWLIGRFCNNVERNPMLFLHLRDQVTAIRLIGPNAVESGTGAIHIFKDILCASTVRNIRPMDDHFEQIAFGINKHMSFAAPYIFFPRQIRVHHRLQLFSHFDDQYVQRLVLWHVPGGAVRVCGVPY
jgi:hypothetical protein